MSILEGISGVAEGADAINKGLDIGKFGSAAGIAGTAVESISGGSVAGSAMGSALKFASAGAALGPIGMAGGAILGGVLGLIKGNKEKDAAESLASQQKWNSAVASRPNPSSKDLSISQYGQVTGGSSKTYLKDKFGISDPSSFSGGL